MWDLWMHRALALASLAEGQTSPNPLVVAVVLDRWGPLLGRVFMPVAVFLTPKWVLSGRPVLRRGMERWW